MGEKRQHGRFKLTLIKHLAAIIALGLLTASLGAQTVIAEDTPFVPPVPPREPTVKELVQEAFHDAPVMVHVAQAESQFNPKAKNPNSTATGVFQILIGTWNGYGCTGDRTNAHDNIRCARAIYEAEGTRPWNASIHAWGA